MIGTTAALILGGLSAAGAIGGAVLGSKATGEAVSEQTDATKYAADVQLQAIREANALAAAQYAQNREDLAPWRGAGEGSLIRLSDLLKPSGEMDQDFAYQDFSYKADPGYDFRLKEGQKAIERSAAARGTLLGGGTLRDLTSFAQGTASDEYQNAYNRWASDYARAFNTFNANRANRLNPLLSLAGAGQVTTQQLGEQGIQTARQQGANLMTGANITGDLATQAANARASGYITNANNWSNAINSGLNFGQNLYLANLLKG